MSDIGGTMSAIEGSLKPLSVLVTRDATGLWVALCLDFDFATQARALEEIPIAFERAYAARVRRAGELGENPFEGGRPAPLDYWRKFQAAAFWREIPLGEVPAFARKLSPAA